MLNSKIDQDSKEITLENWLGDYQLGKDIWNNKYRFNNESFEQFLERVSNGDEEVKDLILNKMFIFGGRVLANYNTSCNKASISNCYSSGYVEDSLEGWMNMAKNLALTYKSQGGQGVSLSRVRPKDSPIGDGRYVTDGIVPLMEILNSVTQGVSQGASRKGALMMSLSGWHKEIETFIKIKSEEGKIEGANLPVEVDDTFMNIVKKDLENGTKTTVQVKAKYGDKVIEYPITPIEVFKLIAETGWDWGEPGVIYTNEFRNHNIMQYRDDYQIITGNPCLHPDTLVQTTEGEVRIKDMTRPMKVYCMDKNGKLTIGQASPSFITKKKAEIMSLTLSNGRILKVTPNHKIFIKNKGWTEAKNIEKYDIPIALLRRRRGAKYAGVRLSSQKREEEKMEHRLIYEGHYGDISNDMDVHHIDGNTYNNTIDNLKLLPHSTHATITRYEVPNNHMVQDSQTGKFISPKNSKKGKKTIVCLPEHLKTNFKTTPRIIDIKKDEDIDVYDVTVDKYHNFVAEGIIVHNCGEQPLPKNGACLLGSVNLGAFVKYPYTKEAQFDFEAFRHAVRVSIRALDTALDYGLDKHALEEQRYMAENYRNVGLGIMGVGTLCMKMGHYYGDEKSLELLDKIGNYFFREAVISSSHIGAQKGSFPKYDEKVWESDIINEHFSKEEIEQLKKDGLRNCALLSIAPSGLKFYGSL